MMRRDALELYRRLIDGTKYRRKYDYAEILADIYINKSTVNEAARKVGCPAERIKSILNKLHHRIKYRSPYNPMSEFFWASGHYDTRWLFQVTDAIAASHPIDVGSDILFWRIEKKACLLSRMDRAYSNPARTLPP